MSRTKDGGSPTDSLQGVCVLDLTSVSMEPFAIQTFGDMSTDVIKIESSKRNVFCLAGPSRNPGMGHARTSATAVKV